MVIRKGETIDWRNPNLCYHVIDFDSQLTNKDEILKRLNSILENGLLTAKEQWRRKNSQAVSNPDSIDVFVGRETVKEVWIRQAVNEFWTAVWILLEWKNHSQPDNMQFRWPYFSCRNGYIEIWEKPRVVGLILKEEQIYVDIDSNFKKEVYDITIQYWIVLLDEKLKPIRL